MSEDFYERSLVPYTGIIVKICRAYTHNQNDFEDYFQEVCLQVWKSRERFKGNSQWSTFVYRIALNVCLSLQRKEKPQTVFKENHLQEQAYNHAFENEDLRQLYEAIKKLKEIDRAIILLYLEEKTYAEIAEILGRKSNAIGVRINRIKKQLKELLHEYH